MPVHIHLKLAANIGGITPGARRAATIDGEGSDGERRPKGTKVCMLSSKTPKRLCSFFCMYLSLQKLYLCSCRFPSHHPSFCSSISVSFCSSLSLVSKCLFLLVSADLSNCQLFLKTGPCPFLAPSFLFLSFFSPLFPLFCSADTDPHARSLTHKHAHVDKLILSLSVSSTSSCCLSLSLSHILKTALACSQQRTPTQGLALKCSNEYEWEQNEEFMSS